MSRSNQLPKGHQWPVKASVIVSDVNAYRPDLDVRSVAFPMQSYFQRDRIKMIQEGKIHVLDCYYSPDGRAFPPSDSPHVDVWIRAVEKESWAQANVRPEQILHLVHEHLDYVTSNKAWNAHWWLGISWLGKVRKLEFSSRINGTWKTGETFTRLIATDN